MKLQNAINKLTKLGLKVTKDGQFYSARTKRHVIEFRVSRYDDAITLIRVIGFNDKDDFIQDYCAGIWCDNLSQAIKLAD